MKFTVNIDCTPDEARAFLGLPDVKPLQEKMLNQMQEKMSKGLENMDPEAMMKMWMPAAGQGAEAIQNMFSSFMNLNIDKTQDK